jgi:hypothetical protein
VHGEAQPVVDGDRGAIILSHVEGHVTRAVLHKRLCHGTRRGGGKAATPACGVGKDVAVGKA